MDTANSTSTTEAITADNFAVTRSTARGYITGRELKPTRADGSTTECQEREYLHSKTVRNTTAPSKTINFTARVG